MLHFTKLVNIASPLDPNINILLRISSPRTLINHSLVFAVEEKLFTDFFIY